MGLFGAGTFKRAVPAIAFFITASESRKIRQVSKREIYLHFFFHTSHRLEQ
jgi:hypothetical protein